MPTGTIEMRNENPGSHAAGASKRGRAAMLLALGCLIGCAGAGTPEAGPGWRTVSFPRVPLAAGERIESVEVVIGCARFVAVHRIPDDWSVEVLGPVSEESTLKAEAGHGVSSLWSSRDFEDFFTLRVVEPSCFSIRGRATAFAGDAERTLSFAQSDFVLRPSPRRPRN
jgi:hypothetical protein